MTGSLSRFWKAIFSKPAGPAAIEVPSTSDPLNSWEFLSGDGTPKSSSPLTSAKEPSHQPAPVGPVANPAPALGRLPGLRAAPISTRKTSSGPVTYAGGGPLDDIEEIADLASLGRHTSSHKLRLSPAVRGLPQIPLFDAGALPPDTVSEHTNAAEPYPVFLYGLVGYELGGLGLLQSGGRVFTNRDTLPDYYTGYLSGDQNQMSDQWTGALFNPKAEIIEVDGTIAVPLHPNLVYGHFLLEMLPKLHILSRLRRAGLPFTIAIPDEIATWAKRIISLYFDDSEILFYDARRQRVRSPCFIAPSMMQSDHWFHPDFNMVVDELVDFVRPRVTTPDSPRLWLSRSKQKGWRAIRNEGEVEKTVADLGFSIIHPQDLSFPEQVALFDQAQVIACEYTSATHNTLFAKRGTPVFCINRVNWYQSGIGALRSQPLAFMLPKDGHFRDWRMQSADDNEFEVDCDKLQMSLKDFLNQSLNVHRPYDGA
jgi:capsular polysaccharide biosynthesis protein